ncbi:HAD family hydrolase [Halobaculum sp. MBLA0143]|uniref:HAD family hydrolase n=1 Tax=Halobaculum sp. MBLA0143 TaxID=3079933 RepID=UPI00352415CE
MTANSFELFGTLVDADLPDDPARAVGRELADRGVDLPADWATAYDETHIDPPAEAVVPLPAHVSAALGSRGVDAPDNAPRRAVVAAFDPEVRTREGASEALAAAADRGPVAVLADAPAPELARRTLIRADLDRSLLDATVSTAACGWALTAPEAHETVARRLGAERVVHVGRAAVDREQARDVTETPLPALAREWRESPDDAAR